jgi:Eukaryotic aspartyl protease
MMNHILFATLLLCAVLSVQASRVPLTRKSDFREAYVAAEIEKLAALGKLEPDTMIAAGPFNRQRVDHSRGSSDTPLRGGDRIGEVYVDYSLGMYDFSAQFDTGSSDLATASTACAKCAPGATLYNPQASRTAQTIACSGTKERCPKCDSGKCAYQNRYGDGSGYDADLWWDNMSFGNFSVFTQAAGAITSEENPNGGTFEPKFIGGIMGSAYQALSATNSQTPIDSLVATGQMDDVFSMCMGDKGGTMELGGVLPYHDGRLSWTPITKQLWYVVETVDVRVYNRSLGLTHFQMNRGNVIVDSGTTLAIVNNAIFDAFQSALEDGCSDHPLVGVCGKGGLFDNKCVKLTPQDIAAYPPLEFVFGGGASTYIYPEHYLMSAFCAFRNFYGLGIVAGGPSGTILGDVYHKGVVAVYDRANTRFGWAPVRGCPSPSP